NVRNSSGWRARLGGSTDAAALANTLRRCLAAVILGSRNLRLEPRKAGSTQSTTSHDGRLAKSVTEAGVPNAWIADGQSTPSSFKYFRFTITTAPRPGIAK